MSLVCYYVDCFHNLSQKGVWVLLTPQFNLFFMQKVFLAAFVALSFFIGLPFQVIAQIRSDIATATAEQTAQNCILATEDGAVCTAAAAGTATKT